jgi:benzoyl-CoA reductase/2-hydroxyglutaryl-CoA dehydratase subunit BcrC/BadD/HgdB
MAKTKQQKRLKRLKKIRHTESFFQTKKQEMIQYFTMKRSIEKVFPNIDDRLKYIKNLIKSLDEDLENVLPA